MGPQGGQGNGGKAEFGTVDPNFRTERAKGQLDPKGRMGISTFRGLPKPGELTVEMVNAVREERALAESAIEKDEIPRRYRDGIRTWFEGLDAKDGQTPK